MAPSIVAGAVVMAIDLVVLRPLFYPDLSHAMAIWLMDVHAIIALLIGLGVCIRYRKELR